MEGNLMLFFNITTLMISIIAIIFTGLTYKMQAEDKEELKKFRTKPKISALASTPEFMRDEKTNNIYIQFKDIQFDIIELNNLLSAYLVNSDKSVDNLKIDDSKLLLVNDKNQIATINLDVDAENNGVFYRYKFLVTKSLSEDYDVFLIYSKEQSGLTNFVKLDEVEIMKFMSYPKDSVEYKMLEQYKKIVDWILDNKL